MRPRELPVSGPPSGIPELPPFRQYNIIVRSGARRDNQLGTGQAPALEFALCWPLISVHAVNKTLERSRGQHMPGNY